MLEKSLLIVFIVIFNPLSLTLADEHTSEIEILVSNPVYYHGREVTVEGQIEKVHYAKSVSGEAYTLFRMYDGEDNTLGVYLKGRLDISGGAKVRVTGEFKKEKRALIYRFKNVIKASEVEKIGLVKTNIN